MIFTTQEDQDRYEALVRERDDLRARLDKVSLKAAESDAWQEVVLKIGRQRDELLAKLDTALASLKIERDHADASERACAQMRRVLEHGQEMLFDDAPHYAIELELVDHALSLDAGRDYVPKAEMDAAWCNGMTDAVVEIELYAELSEYAREQCAKKILAVRDARKAAQ